MMVATATAYGEVLPAGEACCVVFVEVEDALGIVDGRLLEEVDFGLVISVLCL